jgi:hypothetical protein
MIDPDIGVIGRPDSGMSGRVAWQAVPVDWTPDEVLVAVRSAMSGRVRPSWAVERVELDRDQVMIVIRTGEQRFGALYSLAELPFGPNTGEPCDTPRDWAEEISWDMEEQMDTGGLLRAERLRGSDGLVRLRWRV